MNTVLSIAHSKTGQHWVIWLLANYQRLINNNPPMTWVEILEYSKIKGSLDLLAHEREYHSETINFVRIEYPYNYNSRISRFIKSFDKTMYLYRSPHDVMISMFYYFNYHGELGIEIRAKKDFKDWKFFDDYVKEKIDIYCNHIERSIDYVDLVLYYDDLLIDPSPFRELLSFFYDEIDEDIFQKTLEISSFKHVHNLEMNFPKNLGKDPKDTPLHARSGRSGQYHELMNPELINYITEKWEELKLKVKYKLK
jgi:hypothetical protein